MIRIWGKDRSVIGKPLEEAVPELQGQHLINILQNVWKTGLPYEATNTPSALKVAGTLSTFYFDFRYLPISDERGQVYCILHTARDVSDRFRHEQLISEGKLREQTLVEELASTNQELGAMNEELAAINEELNQSYHHLKVLNQHLFESEARFRNLVKQAPVAICVLEGPDLYIELVNDKVLELWGRTEDVIGKPLIVARPEIAEHPYLKILQEVFSSGETFTGTNIKSRILRQGELKEGYFDAVYHPIKGDNGSVTRIMAIITEVTERYKAEKELEQLYGQIQLAKQASGLGLFDLDPRSGKLEWDSRCRELFGIYDGREVSYEDAFLQGLHPEDRNRVNKIVERAYNKALSNGEYEAEFRTVGADDGIIRWVRANGKVLFDHSDRPERFIGTVQDVTKQLMANQSLQRAEEMLRLSVDAARLGTWMLDLSSETYTFSPRVKELHGYHATDATGFTELTNQITEEFREVVKKASAEAISVHSSFNYEYPVIGYHDQKLRWLRTIGKPYFDDQNHPSHFAGVIMDITEQKQDEQRKNDFIGIVSHELKTPLTSLKAYIQMLLKRASKQNDTFALGALEKVNIQVNKMVNMINSFLNVSRLESGKLHLYRQNFDLNELVKEVIEDILLVNTRHTILFFPDGTLPIYADRDKIGQVVSNFLSNAIKYSLPDTVIEINCKPLGLGLALVSVQDEGIGIGKEDREKLFERFYRVENQKTKNISGFGIGLYLCAEIIRRHQGEIWVESEQGKGSTFFFTLPVVNPEDTEKS